MVKRKRFSEVENFRPQIRRKHITTFRNILVATNNRVSPGIFENIQIFQGSYDKLRVEYFRIF